MTETQDFLVKDYAQRNRIRLDRVMRVCEGSDAVLVDTSFAYQFPQLVREQSEGILTISETFLILERFKRDLLGRLDYPISFPKQVHEEYKHGLDRLEDLAHTPYAALCFHLGAGCLSAEVELKGGRESYDCGVDSLKKVISAGRVMHQLQKVFPSEAYLVNVAPDKLKAIESATKFLADTLPRRDIERDRKGPRECNLYGDASIYAALYAISLPGKRTHLLTCDDGFFGFQRAMYGCEQELADRFGFEPSRGTVTIVAPGRKSRLRILSSNQVKAELTSGNYAASNNITAIPAA